MNKDIIARKRKYADLDLSFDGRLDRMLERRWSVGDLLVVGMWIAGAAVLAYYVSQIVVGLD